MASYQKSKLIILAIIAAVLGIILAFLFPLPLNNTGRQKQTAPINESGEKKETAKGVDAADFSTECSWSSADGWSGAGVYKWRGQVVNDKYKMKEGFTASHLALKYRGGLNFSEINIDVNIPEPRSSVVHLTIGTANNGEKIDNLAQPGGWVKISKKLDEGESHFNLKSITWKRYTFFKVVFHRKSVEVPSPSIESIEVS